jgi:uncharacterized membrane protein
MRIGTFLLGGIAGAAAVVYLNRKTKSMMFSAFNSSNDSMGKMMNKAQNTFSNQASQANSTAQGSQRDQSGQSQNAGKGDTLLHQAANEILNNAEEKSANMH